MRGTRILERWSIRSTRTDDDGRYELVGLPPGEHPFSSVHEHLGFHRSTCGIADGVKTHEATFTVDDLAAPPEVVVDPVGR